MASISTSETGAKKRALIGRKKAGRNSAGRRRNGAISNGLGKAANENGVVLPRMEFEMALEIAGPDEKNWTAIVRDAAEGAGGDLLFVLPYADPPGAEAANAEDGGSSGDASPVEHAMVRLLEDGESRLLLVRAGAAGFHLVEEDAIDAGLVRFARASIDVLERLGSDNRIVAPLVTLATH
jgi:hypothetical protein